MAQLSTAAAELLAFVVRAGKLVRTNPVLESAGKRMFVLEAAEDEGNSGAFCPNCWNRAN